MRRREFSEFSENLTDISQGIKISPAYKAVVEDLLELVYQYDKRNGTDLLEHTRDMFSSINSAKKHFNFDFAEEKDESFDEAEVSQERLDLHKQAKSLQSRDSSLSYEEAVILSAKNYSF